MTKNEFAKLIENGRDIMFDTADKHFNIFTWCEEGIGIDEQDPNSKGRQYFQTAEELLTGYLVDGVPLGDLSDKVVITDYS